MLIFIRVTKSFCSILLACYIDYFEFIINQNSKRFDAFCGVNPYPQKYRAVSYFSFDYKFSE